MVRAPSCSTCGSFLTGFELDKELNFFIHFCPDCRSAEEKTARLKEEVAEGEAVREAA
jgi:thiol-disulfide isomerase/thioredoxin